MWAIYTCTHFVCVPIIHIYKKYISIYIYIHSTYMGSWGIKCRKLCICSLILNYVPCNLIIFLKDFQFFCVICTQSFSLLQPNLGVFFMVEIFITHVYQRNIFKTIVHSLELLIKGEGKINSNLQLNIKSLGSDMISISEHLNFI
jgi:hypothetical protein